MDVVSTERPRLPVQPMSDARFEAVKTMFGVNDEMQQVSAHRHIILAKLL